MRKIRTKEELEARSKRNSRIVTALLLIILLGSTAGYAFLSYAGGSEQKTNSSNKGVENIGDKWVLKSGEQNFVFTNSPTSSDGIPINLKFSLQDYTEKPLYIVSDSDVISYEISSNLGRFSNRVQSACYGKCDKNLPEKDCTDNLIVWKQAENNSIVQKDNCVFIEGNMRAVDAFLYKIFKIN